MTLFFFVSTQLTKFFNEKLFGSDPKVVVVAQHWILHKLKEADDYDAPLSLRAKQHM